MDYALLNEKVDLKILIDLFQIFVSGCAMQEVLMSMLMTISKSESIETPNSDFNTSEYIKMVPTTKVTIQPVKEDTSSAHPELASIEETMSKSAVKNITERDSSISNLQCDKASKSLNSTDSNVSINYIEASGSEQETTNEYSIPSDLETSTLKIKKLKKFLLLLHIHPHESLF